MCFSDGAGISTRSQVRGLGVEVGLWRGVLVGSGVGVLVEVDSRVGETVNVIVGVEVKDSSVCVSSAGENAREKKAQAVRANRLRTDARTWIFLTLF